MSQEVKVTKRGKSVIVEVGKVFGRIAVTGTRVNMKRLKFKVWVGASEVKARSFQIDKWVLKGSKEIDEAVKRLRPGMTVCVKGYRRTAIHKDEDGIIYNEQFNEVEAIKILSPKPNGIFKFANEVNIYDRTIK